MTEKYSFKTKHENSQRILICPECGEQLTHMDIEIFPHCPYCDHAFEKTGELEDFILEPLVQRWISKYNSPYMSDQFPPIWGRAETHLPE
jgi:uncharacterized C2H2 Zn-finger protein